MPTLERVGGGHRSIVGFAILCSAYRMGLNFSAKGLLNVLIGQD